jgi:hypothetical protein
MVVASTHNSKYNKLNSSKLLPVGELSLSNDHKFTFRSVAEMPTWLPTPWVRRGFVVDDDYTDRYENVIAYTLSRWQKLFVYMEYPNVCRASRFYQYFTIVIIIISVLTAYIGTNEIYQNQPSTCKSPVCNNDQKLCPGRMVCRPGVEEKFLIIDFICCIFYLCDISIRLFLVPIMSARILRIIPSWWDEIESKKPMNERLEEPSYGPLEKIIRYVFNTSSIIDITATIPYFAIILANQFEKPGSPIWTYGTTGSTIMAVRIARCFRLLKVLDVHPQGSPKLSIIINTVYDSASSLFILLGFVFISAITFGSLIYAFEKGNFEVTNEYPNGAYFRLDLYGMENELSPFSSLGVCMYWAIVTMSTLGYGDLYPTSTLGRVIGAVCSVYGVLVISLPVTIIGNAFGDQMDSYKASVADEKRQLNIKRHKVALKLQTLRGFVSGSKKSSSSSSSSNNNEELLLGGENDHLIPESSKKSITGTTGINGINDSDNGSGIDSGGNNDSDSKPTSPQEVEVAALEHAHDLPFHGNIKMSEVHSPSTLDESFLDALHCSQRHLTNNINSQNEIDTNTNTNSEIEMTAETKVADTDAGAGANANNVSNNPGVGSSTSVKSTSVVDVDVNVSVDVDVEKKEDTQTDVDVSSDVALTLRDSRHLNLLLDGAGDGDGTGVSDDIKKSSDFNTYERKEIITKILAAKKAISELEDALYVTQMS